MEETIRGERNTWKERIYPSKHTKENRRSGLGQIQKDGEIQTQYGYDAFGNRTWKEENGERTSYQYNILNQMVSEKHREVWKEYGYSSYWSRCRSRNKFNIARDKYCERKTEKI